MILSLFFSLSLAWSKQAPPLHLDLEATSKELEQFLYKQNKVLNLQLDPTVISADPLDQVIEVGKRNLDWLQFINAHQSAPISFTKPGSLRGIPITNPAKYSGDLTLQKFQNLAPQLLSEMRRVLIQGEPFTENPPEPVDEYLRLGNEIDRLYQTALRWRGMQPWLSWYEQNRQSDIRGYYFLKLVPDLQNKLQNWNLLTADEQNDFTTWLLSECYNSLASDSSCRQQLSEAEAQNKRWDFHEKFLPTAEATFDELYVLQNPRSDLISDPAANTTTINIKNQNSSVLENFLKFNIEDEWHWLSWKLLIAFSPSANVEVFWQPGVTPHVNGLGGNKIYMDSNAPISEWDVQWTIRHEFGHVLGFPDCYVEFYDRTEAVMVSYQIDTTDLMCSRAGKLKQRHYQDFIRHTQKTEN